MGAEIKYKSDAYSTVSLDKKNFNKEDFKKKVEIIVKALYRKTIEEATPKELFQAVAYTVKDIIIDDWWKTQKNNMKKMILKRFIIFPWNF